jgi:hypothetical protein
MRVGTLVHVDCRLSKHFFGVTKDEVFEITSWGARVYNGDPNKGTVGQQYAGHMMGCTVWNEKHGSIWVAKEDVEPVL